MYISYCFKIYLNALLNPCLSDTVISVRAWGYLPGSLKSLKHLEACKSHLDKPLTNTSQFIFQGYLKSINSSPKSIMLIVLIYKCIFQLKILLLSVGLFLFVFWPHGKVSGFLILCLCSAHLESRSDLENICQISRLLISNTSGALSGKEETSTGIKSVNISIYYFQQQWNQLYLRGKQYANNTFYSGFSAEWSIFTFFGIILTHSWSNF